MRLTGKTAFVTGAAQGFGLAIAQTFAREGARVACADWNGAGAEAAAKSIGAGAIALACDVAKAADVAAASQAALSAFGHIDILVNNAGTSHRNRPMLEVDEAEFDRVFAVNVKSIFLMAHAFVPEMRRHGSGVGMYSLILAAVLKAVSIDQTTQAQRGQSPRAGFHRAI